MMRGLQVVGGSLASVTRYRHNMGRVNQRGRCLHVALSPVKTTFLVVPAAVHWGRR